MKRVLFTGAMLLVAASAFSQFGFNYFKVSQPWYPYPFPQGRWASHEARVLGCENARPMNRVAMDDWVCTRTGPIIRVDWWGTMPTAVAQIQKNRPFYIAIYGDNGNCQPRTTFGQQNAQHPYGALYARCVVPDVVKFVGVDCQNQPVFFFSAPLPPGPNGHFRQTAGTRYWLQVSEADRESARINVEDFRWSGHRPITPCPAVLLGLNAAGQPVFSPAIDACDGQMDDLAFRLRSRALFVTIARNPAHSIFRLSLFDTAGNLVETMSVEPDENGNASLDTDAPDGTYQVLLEGMGALPKRGTLQLGEGVERRLDFFDVFYGDLDGDLRINDEDLLQVLFNFGRSFNN